ncbi:MAG: diacylglycerol kinase family protein [Bacteroidia bacterium]|jgi:diacylglycerol kinase|nr:diacylglycerol kinase family protein [Bacteroidia bacterium]
MKSFFKSFLFAINGIKLSFLQRNFKIHVACAIIAAIGGVIFQINLTEWCIILFCIGLVVSLEMINTALEQLVNLIEPNYNPKAGAIKDVAAGAVLVSSVISAIIGVMIFGKYILDLLFTY